jgi:hypothetical protein
MLLAEPSVIAGGDPDKIARLVAPAANEETLNSDMLLNLGVVAQ